MLLPEAVDDYVGPDNPVRFVEAFVDGLDLAAAGFERVAAKETGRPGFDPADILKLYIYGYINRVRSSRRLEAETHRNIEVIWLLRHLKPDFRTIADFRRVNRAAFKLVFREFVILCRQLDLFGRELLAVDGTRIKAVNNKDRNFTRASLAKFIREADEKLADYMKRLDAVDADEEKVSGGNGSGGDLAEKIAAIKGKRDRHRALLDELERSGEDQISLTDPDARAMARMTKVGVGYNVQLAVDTKHKMIAEQEVCNQVIDLGLLAPTVEAAMDTLGVDRIDAVADRGYFKIEDIEACEAAGITAYVPKPLRGPAVAQGFFPKEEFYYDADADTYTCPAGQTLRPRYYGKLRENVKVIYCNRKACKGCGLRAAPVLYFQILSRRHPP
ncbi:IS1182 family transposase [Mesorhizobium zhangyense]|uniref:IS1182 family transposase n=1 Tax=Mesorhizobium zhangyense TaxID=1776730 RepID=UPI001FE2494A|nr:IS1182 family transposase [Mesorhizobium zhangyense]